MSDESDIIAEIKKPVVKRQPRPREVIGIIQSHDVIRETACKNLKGHVEVREHANGKFTIWYPDEGFTPCAPVCDTKHKHSFKQDHVQSFYHPTDRDDAFAYADQIADGRDVKYVKVGGGRFEAKLDVVAEDD